MFSGAIVIPNALTLPGNKGPVESCQQLLPEHKPTVSSQVFLYLSTTFISCVWMLGLDMCVWIPDFQQQMLPTSCMYHAGGDWSWVNTRTALLL